MEDITDKEDNMDNILPSWKKDEGTWYINTPCLEPPRRSFRIAMNCACGALPLHWQMSQQSQHFGESCLQLKKGEGKATAGPGFLYLIASPTQGTVTGGSGLDMNTKEGGKHLIQPD